MEGITLEEYAHLLLRCQLRRGGSCSPWRAPSPLLSDTAPLAPGRCKGCHPWCMQAINLLPSWDHVVSQPVCLMWLCYHLLWLNVTFLHLCLLIWLLQHVMIYCYFLAWSAFVDVDVAPFNQFTKSLLHGLCLLMWLRLPCSSCDSWIQI